MPKIPKNQSVTMVGGKNIAPQTKPPKPSKPKPPPPEPPAAESEKEPKNE